MSRILMAWELGGGYGHIASIAPVAHRLIERGHDVTVALRDLSLAERALGASGCELLQAPLWINVQMGAAASPSYAHLLTRFGYLDPPALTGLVRAWRSLIERVQPDVLVVEHAPTALLAARGLPVRRFLFGTGFTCPPPVSPMPLLGGQNAPPERALLDLEERVRRTLDEVLAAVGGQPLDALGNLFAADAHQVCTFPELDPFAELRTDAEYAGPRGLESPGVAPRWPAAGKRRLFGYLRAGVGGFEALVRHLANSPESVLVHVPGMPAEFIRRFSSPSLTLSPEPVDLARVSAECDGAIGLAGHGTTCRMLLAGCPLLLLPYQVEQRLTAERVAGIGAGIVVRGNQGAAPFPDLIAHLLGDERLREGARAFAEVHADFDERRATAGTSHQIERLAAAA